MDLLNDIILNVFKNFIPKKIVKRDERDEPWINDNIENKMKGRNSMYKNYNRKSKKIENYELLAKAVSDISRLIEKSKDGYFNRFWANNQMTPAQAQNLTVEF